MIWSLEDAELVRLAGARERRWPLAGLKRAMLREQRLRRAYPAAPIRVVSLGLAFAGGRTALSGEADAELCSFLRRLLNRAADLAPKARFVRAPSALAGGLVLAGLLLALGVASTLLFALSSRTAALGLDLTARLVFVILLLVAAWPWLLDERRRRFDPRNPPL